MKIAINNQVDHFLKFITAIKEKPEENQTSLWDEYCYSYDPKMYQFMLDNYEQIDSSLDIANEAIKKNGLEVLEKKLLCTYENLQNSLERVVSELGRYMKDIQEIQINLVVGNTSTNAFVTNFRGRSLFIFAERLPDDPYRDVLISHELSHVIHQESYAETCNDPTVLDLIFLEGVAINLSKIACPGLEVMEYINFSKDAKESERKGYIKEHFDQIKSDVLRSDNEIIKLYMSGSKSNKSRIGYDIGYYLVEILMNQLGVEKVLRMRSDEVKLWFEDHAEMMLKCLG